ncbi:MAG: hypothetical protein AABX88_01270, partial [Nanoarchaeota archaeon]
DGKDILIERTLKRSKSISQDYCSITIDGEQKEISVSELKNTVLELLSYPKEFSKKQNLLYKFTVYTPQEEMKQIIIQDVETRINTLRHVFGIDKYKRILENVSILTLKLREEKRKKEGAISTLEQDKSNLIFKESELKNKKEGLIILENELNLKKETRKKIQEESIDINKKIAEKNKFQQETEKTRIMIANKEDVFIDNLKLLGQIKTQIDELNKLQFDDSRIGIIEKEILLYKSQKEKLNGQFIEVSSQTTFLINKNEDLKKLKQKFSGLESCPTCLQKVDSVYRANILNKTHSETFENNQKIEIFQKEKIKLFEEIKKIDSEIFFSEKNLESLKISKMRLQGIAEKQKQVEQIEKTMLFLRNDIDMLNKHMDVLKKSVFELQKFERIFQEKQKEFEESTRQERIADIKVAELKKEIEVFSKQIEELRMRIDSTEQIKKQLDYLNELENWLSKKFAPMISFIEKNVMINLKSRFSQLFSEWFSILVSDNFNVRLDDDFTPVIEQQDYQLDYSFL